jgi:hypothetical protein
MFFWLLKKHFTRQFNRINLVGVEREGVMGEQQIFKKHKELKNLGLRFFALGITYKDKGVAFNLAGGA